MTGLSGGVGTPGTGCPASPPPGVDNGLPLSNSTCGLSSLNSAGVSLSAAKCLSDTSTVGAEKSTAPCSIPPATSSSFVARASLLAIVEPGSVCRCSWVCTAPALFGRVTANFETVPDLTAAGGLRLLGRSAGACLVLALFLGTPLGIPAAGITDGDFPAAPVVLLFGCCCGITSSSSTAAAVAEAAASLVHMAASMRDRTV
mmetsp:Transcript_7627/g.21692  ORF Transcript_7627/g.21692 Transcript_7627/m.21692 type:complete len:202 (-) Transcript_7627:1957-2562(-)